MYVLSLTVHSNGCCCFFPHEVKSFSKIFFSDDSAKILVSPKSKYQLQRGESNVEDLTFESVVACG